MSADGSGERPKVRESITVDRALQTVGGLLLLVCLGITSWTMVKVVDHDGTIKVHDVQLRNLDNRCTEDKREMLDRLSEIKRWIEKVADKVGAK